MCKADPVQSDHRAQPEFQVKTVEKANHLKVRKVIAAYLVWKVLEVSPVKMVNPAQEANLVIQ